MEQSAASETPQSWLLDLLRASRLPRLIGGWLAPVVGRIDKLLSRLSPARAPRPVDPKWRYWGDWIYNAVMLALVVGLLVAALRFVHSGVGWTEVGVTALLGLATLGRVLALLIASTLVWTPIGVAIGFKPRLASLAQPVAQLLASFPANFLFPFATIFFIRSGIMIGRESCSA